MEWDSDYIVHRTETETLWRLLPDDRFGPYLLSGPRCDSPGTVNMTVEMALDWLINQAGLDPDTAVNVLEDAEAYIREGADQCRYSLVDAKPV